MINTASVVRKLLIKTGIQTKSPLRIGSGIDDGITDILILKDKQGKCFIPGTSIGGVLRAEFEALYGADAANMLFGYINGNNDGSQSMINISDIVLKNADVVYRDGVAIDYITGTSIDGAKYDYEAIERGAEGELTIEVTVRSGSIADKIQNSFDYKHKAFADKNDVIGDMMALLADILSSGISVGSLTAKGFGKIAAQEPAKVYDFNFADGKDCDAWLAYLQKDEYKNQLIYTASIKETVYATEDFVMNIACALRSSLLVRDNYVPDEKKSDSVTSIQMKSKNDYVIPGTSLKGVFRNAAKKILLTLSGYKKEEGCDEILDILMGTDKYKDNKAHKSRLFVDEVYIKPNNVNELRHSRNRIDRFTGGTVDGALFTDVPVWQSDKSLTPVNISVIVKKCSAAEAGLLLLLLKEIWLGNINIGSGKAIGRGVLYGRKCEINYKGQKYQIAQTDKFEVTGDKAQLEAYVQALAGEINGK